MVRFRKFVGDGESSNSVTPSDDKGYRTLTYRFINIDTINIKTTDFLT